MEHDQEDQDTGTVTDADITPYFVAKKALENIALGRVKSKLKNYAQNTLNTLEVMEQEE